MKRGRARAAPEADARLAALAERWTLDASAVSKLRDLLALVAADRRAATAVRSPAEAVHVHVADSLSALPLLDQARPAPGQALRVVDIGSGAGFPGLPIAIARPQAEVDRLEATARKCEFLEEARDALALAAVRVVNARAEEWGAAAGRERYDVVLVRAVATLATLAEYAAPLLAAGGRLIAWKGARDAAEEDAARRAAAELGLEPRAVERVKPYPGSRDHNLHLYEKVRATPERFPRRPGAARKHPLGRRPG